MNTSSAHIALPLSSRTRARGAVLLVALIFLILLTLLAIGASSGSLLQQKMVGATRSSQLAMMSGESALRGGEWEVWRAASAVGSGLGCGGSAINTTTGCIQFDQNAAAYGATGDVTKFRTGDNTWLALSGPVTYMGPDGTTGFTSAADAADTASPNVAENPQYIIEDLGQARPPGAGTQHESGDTGTTQGGSNNTSTNVYRITARATGGTDSTVRVLESTFDAHAN